MANQTALIVALGALLTVGTLVVYNYDEMIDVVVIDDNGSHYEDPKPNGCEADELAMKV